MKNSNYRSLYIHTFLVFFLNCSRTLLFLPSNRTCFLLLAWLHFANFFSGSFNFENTFFFLPLFRFFPLFCLSVYFIPSIALVFISFQLLLFCSVFLHCFYFLLSLLESYQRIFCHSFEIFNFLWENTWVKVSGTY